MVASSQGTSFNMFLLTMKDSKGLSLIECVTCFTVWNFQDFSVTQILRKINFGESLSAKPAIFAIFGAQNFVDLVIFILQKV